ncbi:XRE family transcriptional regulator [Cytobacillus oceanisediminis]|uniref:XRE family transcriptional regulator n=1 Tax=Cytobacillus oceanisediminis TaxID=665099 RepID=UPI00203ACFCF|nr:XRE family transcriptional regulator [Cytobacillus oceanisediminis]MCM3527879.1 XRE family transcriptional regulator [Cytobacillus oceanisediminis]
MYRNLKAEMAREGLTMVDLANYLQLRYATVNEKMNGKYRFYYDEALQIKKRFFPNLSLEYLFEKDKTNQSEEGVHS